MLTAIRIRPWLERNLADSLTDAIVPEVDRRFPRDYSLHMERGSRSSWDSKHKNAERLGSPQPFLLSLIDELPRGRCLDLAAGEASRQGLALNFLVADLTSYPLPVARYDVLLCFRYLERSLWHDMERALRPGGALLMGTFTDEHRRGHPDFPAAYCLAPGELRRAFPLLNVALYHESRSEGAASLFALRH